MINEKFDGGSEFIKAESPEESELLENSFHPHWGPIARRIHEELKKFDQDLSTEVVLEPHGGLVRAILFCRDHWFSPVRMQNFEMFEKQYSDPDFPKHVAEYLLKYWQRRREERQH